MSRFDARTSQYQEDSRHLDKFTPTQRNHMRTLLRRLRFLEARVREAEENSDSIGSWPKLEMEALAWTLYEIKFIVIIDGDRSKN